MGTVETEEKQQAPYNLGTVMVFLHLFIVNKSGGLIHHRALHEKAPSISTNDLLRIGSTFHSLHAIAAEASPARLPGNKNSVGADDGIEEIQAAGLLLRSYQTRTGIKFVITAEPTAVVDLDAVLRDIYILYTDSALKDPFYELDMPIKCERFTSGVDQLVRKMEKIASRGGR